MPRTKARRMAAALQMGHVHRLEYVLSRGTVAGLFPHDQPLVVELGCGKAESLVALALHDSGRNYLGVDIKSARIWSAADAARRLGLDHLQLLLAPAARLPEVLGPETASEVWIPFPDPVGRGSKAHKRLVSPRHLGICLSLMRPGALLHVKSDDAALFAYALRSIEASGFELRTLERDLHRSPRAEAMAPFMSTYERRFVNMGKAIQYVCAAKGAGSPAPGGPQSPQRELPAPGCANPGTRIPAP
jgi:tRNA (guanine-N7-)-methyltransferase